MNEHHDQSTAYAFCLDDVQNDFVYYRTVSLFSGKIGNHGRDQRCAHPVIIVNFERIMSLLRLPVQWVRSDKDVDDWWTTYGWSLIANDYAEQHINTLLGSRECVKSAIGLFWDIAMPRDRAVSRRIPKPVRHRVLERDNHRCIECHRSQTDDVTLTMDHVIPYSRGGETTEGNLVTLCEACNQGHGNADHPHLFALAGLHHGWDPQLLNNGIDSDPDARMFAMMLSHNIMVSRCNKADFPVAVHSNRGTSA